MIFCEFYYLGMFYMIGYILFIFVIFIYSNQDELFSDHDVIMMYIIFFT